MATVPGLHEVLREWMGGHSDKSRWYQPKYLYTWNFGWLGTSTEISGEVGPLVWPRLWVMGSIAEASVGWNLACSSSQEKDWHFKKGIFGWRERENLLDWSRCPQAPSGMVLEHRARGNSWIKSNVTPKQNKRHILTDTSEFCIG